jgi:hypothetical protein
VTEAFLRVVGRDFVAAVRAVDGVVAEAAPLLRSSTLGRSVDALRRLAASRSWRVEVLPPRREYDRVAVVGWRDWPEEARWRVDHAVRALAASYPRTVLVTGEQRGVDRYARETGSECGLVVVVAVAAWDALGYPAGPRRNVEVEALADRCLAFHGGAAARARGHGRGTDDVVRRFRQACKPVDERTFDDPATP